MPTPPAAGPAFSPGPGSSSRRSLGPLIAVIGFVTLGVVAGLAFTMAQGTGTPAGTMSALTSPSFAPTASPTIDLRKTAATKFRAFEDVYLAAYDTLHDTLPASGHFASYEQARSYYQVEVQNLTLFGSNVAEMTFPDDVMPVVRALLERISDEATLMEKLVATNGEAAGWKINEKIMAARTDMNAARVVVGNDLGLTYVAEVTPKPIPKPTSTSKPASKNNVVITFSGDWKHEVNGNNDQFSCLYEGPVGGTKTPSSAHMIKSSDTTREPDFGSFSLNSGWAMMIMDKDGAEVFIEGNLFDAFDWNGDVKGFRSSGNRITFNFRLNSSSQTIWMKGSVICPPQ